MVPRDMTVTLSILPKIALQSSSSPVHPVRWTPAQTSVPAGGESMVEVKSSKVSSLFNAYVLSSLNFWFWDGLGHSMTLGKSRLP